MNADLERIKAALRLLVLWGGNQIAVHDADNKRNAAFIAHARTFAPAAARALFEDIEWFESVANAGTGHTYEHSALLRLKNICRDWPEGAR